MVQMWRRYKFEIVVTIREARDGRFPPCNAGADVGREAEMVAFRTV